MDNSESSPPRDFDCTGTPSTGRMVLAAVMPGRCAAPPAPAISTSSPRSRAPEAYSRSEEHTSELQSLAYLVCRLLLEKKKPTRPPTHSPTLSKTPHTPPSRLFTTP